VRGTKSRSRSRSVVVVGVAAAALAGLTGFAAPANAAPTHHVLPNSAPHWLGHAKKVADQAATTKVSFGILLNLRNAAAAQAQVQAVSDPSSASYGKFLTNKQFNATYAPAASDVKAVQGWLRSQGFAVGQTLPSGQYVKASGTTAQVEKTFSTTLAKFAYQGKTVQTNTTDLSLPSGTSAEIVGAVGGVVGLDQASTLKKPADTEPGPGEGSRTGVQPCSAYYGQKIATAQPAANGKKQPYAVCGYGPQQLQGAYGVSSQLAKGVDGKGVTVVITDAYASPTILQDAQKYNQVHKQPLFKKGQFSQITPSSDGYSNTDLCGASGWYGEETLDVEAVHAMAPGAKVVYVGGADCVTGLDEAWAASIDNHYGDIITNSWSDGVDDLADLGQSYIDFYTQYSTEAALTGITVNFSTGDNGDATAGGTNLAAKTLGFPADLPLVTGVGGTSVQIGSKNQWLGEYGWQNAYSQLSGKTWSPLPGVYSSGGTGGTSQLFAQPWYQRGVVPDSISKAYGTTDPMRTLPDISVAGDPNTGMVVGQTQEFPDGTYWDQYRIGGTSLSSPLLAGVLAVAEQGAHKKFGFANPLYYQMNQTSAIHDIVAPSAKAPVYQVRTDFVNGLDSSEGLKYQLQTIDTQTSTIHSKKGYDDETGVGTPNGAAFFKALTKLK
jgi:subtilase family serine protease